MKLKDKRIMFMWIALNILIVTLGVARILTSQQADFLIEDVTLFDWWGEVSNDGNYRADFPSEKYWFLEEVGPLEPGVYDVNVYYRTNNPSFYLYCDSDSVGNTYPAIYADDYALDKKNTNLSFKVWVNDSINTLRVVIECGRKGEKPEDTYLSVEKIEISRGYEASISYRLLKLLLGVSILNAFGILAVKRDLLKKHFYVLLGLGSIFIVSSLNIFTNSQVQGHDLAFHWARIIGLKEGIIAGSFPVKIQPRWCNDYGYATSVFYGDILLYIPAVLNALKVPLVYAYKIYVLIINFGTVLIAYFSYKRISGDRYIGVGCTALYCLSINRILNVYLRAAVGEYSAFMFLPLVVLGIWEILIWNKGEEEKKDSWCILSLGMTGIIQTHTLSFEMVSLLLLVVCVIMLRRVLRKETILALMKAVGLTVLLNLWFLVPFINYAGEELRVFAEKTEFEGIQCFGCSIYELFSIGTTGTGGAIKSTLGFQDRFPISLGIAMMLIILIAIILYVKYPHWDENERKQLVVVTVLATVALFLSTHFFPWNWLASVGIIKSVVFSIQFPWRFVSIAIPILTLMACLILKKVKKIIKPEGMKCLIIVLCILSAYQGLQYVDMIARNTTNYVKYDGSHILDVKATLSGAEYLYEDTDIDAALQNKEVSGQNIQIFNTERNRNQITVACETGHDAFLEVPLFAYPHYQCEDIVTRERYPIKRGENNRIRVELPDNYTGTVIISFKEPWFWRMAEAISMVSALCLIGYGLYKWKNRGMNKYIGE